MLMIGVMLVVVMVSLVTVCIAGYLLAVHRGRSAADLAALSGAVALGSGEDPCARARSNAESNGAQVTSCSSVGDYIDFVVSVEVQVQVRVLAPGLPSKVTARAWAGSLQGSL